MNFNFQSREQLVTWFQWLVTVALVIVVILMWNFGTESWFTLLMGTILTQNCNYFSVLLGFCQSINTMVVHTVAHGFFALSFRFRFVDAGGAILCILSYTSVKVKRAWPQLEYFSRHKTTLAPTRHFHELELLLRAASLYHVIHRQHCLPCSLCGNAESKILLQRKAKFVLCLQSANVSQYSIWLPTCDIDIERQCWLTWSGLSLGPCCC